MLNYIKEISYNITSTLFEKHYDPDFIFDEKLQRELAFSFTVFSIFLAVAWIGLWVFLNRIIKPRIFKKQKYYDKIEIVGCSISCLHDCFAVYFAMFTVVMCGEYPLAVFYADAKTLRTYRTFYSHSLMFSLAYFFNETWLMLYVYEWKGAYTIQSIVHHIVAIFAGVLV